VSFDIGHTRFFRTGTLSVKLFGSSVFAPFKKPDFHSSPHSQAEGKPRPVPFGNVGERCQLDPRSPSLTDAQRIGVASPPGAPPARQICQADAFDE
jgi:hypothetical protein